MRVFIFSMVAVMVLLTGCNDEKKSASAVVESVKTQAEQTQEKAETLVAEAKQEATAVLNEGKETVVESAQTADKAIEQKVEEVKTAVASVEPSNGEKLFAKCVGCHGAKAEKKALGVSQVIQGWDKEKVLAALHGYKSNTYGGNMKTVMLGQVGSLDDESMNALAEYISTLK